MQDIRLQSAPLFFSYYCFAHGSCLGLKAQQSLPGQLVNGEGLWLNSLDYCLPVCYTQRSLLTVWYVVWY